MFARRLAALLCLLALLAPAGAAMAIGLGESSCVDACCDDTACSDGDACASAAPCSPADGCPEEGDCPDGCPDCACSARARIAVPVHEAAWLEPSGWRPASLAEPAALACDADPREILHVPRVSADLRAS